jgi:hypothetical protein
MCGDDVPARRFILTWASARCSKRQKDSKPFKRFPSESHTSITWLKPGVNKKEITLEAKPTSSKTAGVQLDRQSPFDRLWLDDSQD